MIDATGEEAAPAVADEPSLPIGSRTSGGHAHGRAEELAAVLLTVVALLPVLIVVATRTGHRYVPVQDLAYIDLRVRDVWSRNIPLIGPYSKGFNHPGPLFFWLIGVPARLFGSPAWATLVGAALLQGVAIVACARVAWRRGGLALLAVVLLALLASYPPGAFMFIQQWNPIVAFPFLGLYLLLIWSVSLGERSHLVWAAVVGTFLVQTHISYVALVAVPAMWLVLVLVRDRRTLGSVRAWRRPAGITAIAALVLWLPVVIQQVAHPSQGNMKAIAKYFLRDERPAAGIRTGLGLWAAEWRVPSLWFGGHEPTRNLIEARPSSLAWLIIPVTLVVAAVWAGQRAQNCSDNRFLGLMVVGSATGIVAMATLRGPIVPYLFLWRSQLATFLIAAVVMVIARPLLGGQGGRRAKAATVVLALFLVGLAAYRADPVARFGRGLVLSSESMAQKVLAQLEHRPLPREPVLFRYIGGGGVGEGVMNEMDRRGVPVRVDKDSGYKWGEARTSSAGLTSVWYVVDDGALVSDLTGQRGARVLARVTPLPASEERELVVGQRRLKAQLRKAGRPDLSAYLSDPLFLFQVAGVHGLDGKAVGRVSELNDKVLRSGVCRCAVVAFPASSADLLARDIDVYRAKLEGR